MLSEGNGNEISAAAAGQWGSGTPAVRMFCFDANGSDARVSSGMKIKCFSISVTWTISCGSWMEI